MPLNQISSSKQSVTPVYTETCSMYYCGSGKSEEFSESTAFEQENKKELAVSISIILKILEIRAVHNVFVLEPVWKPLLDFLDN